MRIKTIFFGTHDFAATILKGLIDSPLFEITMVISRPDEPVGRKQEILKTPVKVIAEKFNIPIEQPLSLKNYELRIKNYDVGITAQYGGLIPKHILETPAHGILNVHTSLLPKYRGASPIQSAIMNGDAETGVTIMKMDEGLDTGPIILQKSIFIGPDETTSDVSIRLSELGVQSLYESVPEYIAGSLKPESQDEAKATFCKKLDRDSGKVDWEKNSQEIYNMYRALTPWPGIWSFWKGKRLKFLRVRPCFGKGDPGAVSYEKNVLTIACGAGSLEILDLQLEGKNIVDASAFINGYKDFVHACLE